MNPTIKITQLAKVEVSGGGANAYAYPTNPNDMTDLNGEMWGFVYDGIAGVISGYGVAGACLSLSLAVVIFCNLLLGGIVGALVAAGRQKLVDGRSLKNLDLKGVAAGAVGGATSAVGGGVFGYRAAKKGLTSGVVERWGSTIMAKVRSFARWVSRHWKSMALVAAWVVQAASWVALVVTGRRL